MVPILKIEQGGRLSCRCRRQLALDKNPVPPIGAIRPFWGYQAALRGLAELQ